MKTVTLRIDDGLLDSCGATGIEFSALARISLRHFLESRIKMPRSEMDRLVSEEMAAQKEDAKNKTVDKLMEVSK